MLTRFEFISLVVYNFISFYWVYTDMCIHRIETLCYQLSNRQGMGVAVGTVVS